MKSKTLSLKTIINEIGFSKENSYYLMKRLRKKKFFCCWQNKLIEKIPDPRNAKEHYQSFIRKKFINQNH